MLHLLELISCALWNYCITRRRWRPFQGDLLLGRAVDISGRPGKRQYIMRANRPEHIAVIGKTGTGKSTLLQSFAQQDVTAGNGFIFFDLHGQATETLLASVVQVEERTQRDLSKRTILIDPADLNAAVGMNLLEHSDQLSLAAMAVEHVNTLRARWHLDTFGARTEELLRNCLTLLAEANQTVLEVAPLLTDGSYRSWCLAAVPHGPAHDYFTYRFNALSAAMQTVMAEPVLNKLTTFTDDPHLRHLVGQQRSTVNWSDVLDKHCWVIINLDKGRLGQEAITLGSLLLTQIRRALFARDARRVFTLYCDEIQNLVVYDEGLEELLAEARKFGVSVCSANQYLDQLSPRMRAALLATGSQLLFQLSGPDAAEIGRYVRGTRNHREALQLMPHREFFARLGGASLQRVLATTTLKPRERTDSLRQRINTRWTRKRSAIEEEITKRRLFARKELDGWE